MKFFLLLGTVCICNCYIGKSVWAQFHFCSF